MIEHKISESFNRTNYTENSTDDITKVSFVIRKQVLKTSLSIAHGNCPHWRKKALIVHRSTEFVLFHRSTEFVLFHRSTELWWIYVKDIQSVSDSIMKVSV